MTTLIYACAVVLTLGQTSATPQRVDLPDGHYWLATPPNLDAQQKYPLIVCLHGTETKSQDILAFWISLDNKLPFILAAPQGVQAGWRETDLSFIRQFHNHLLETVNVDPTRVLLTGHSAGGAMAFHLLYAESFQATAVAVTANYLPPTVTSQMVSDRRDVPVFYAVGQADLNRPRMRQGLDLLRSAGANVSVRRPPIGHVLSRQIGGQALQWFEDLCHRSVQDRLDAADLDPQRVEHLGPAAADLEDILRNRATHFLDQFALAADRLARLQQPGRQLLATAQRRLAQKDPLGARDNLIQVQTRYRPSSLAVEATARRQPIEDRPEVIAHLRAKRLADHRQKAQSLYQSALSSLAVANLSRAELCCRRLLDLYPDSDRAKDARNMLDSIKAARPRP